MSRRVIEDLVLPIVLRKLNERGELPRYSRYTLVRDRRLSDFFEEQLVKEFGAIGEVGGRCEALEYILDDLAIRNPSYLEQEIERILNLYISLRTIEAQTNVYSVGGLRQSSPQYSSHMDVKRRRYT